MAGQYARERAAGLQPARNQALAGGLSAPLLRDEPVQALGLAERAENYVGRLAVAARRLARAVRFACRGLARRIGAQRPGHRVAVACRGMIEVEALWWMPVVAVAAMTVLGLLAAR